jgi:hypothetical protein
MGDRANSAVRYARLMALGLLRAEAYNDIVSHFRRFYRMVIPKFTSSSSHTSCWPCRLC